MNIKHANQNLLKWKLTRERFCIDDPVPPRERRTEKCISEILYSILHPTEPESEAPPEELLERWTAIVGEQLAAHAYPAYFKNSILYLYADHAGWLVELRRLPKTQLLKKITTIPNLPEIKDIRFQLDPAIQAAFRKTKKPIK